MEKNVNEAILETTETSAPEIKFDVKALKLEKITWIEKNIIKPLFHDPLTNYILGKRSIRFLAFITRASILKNLGGDGPGSWMSMLAHYDGKSKNWMDKFVNRANAFPMALRNRQQLVVTILKQLIRSFGDKQYVNLTAVGSGSGNNILKAIIESEVPVSSVKAQLFDLNEEGLAYGRHKSKELGLADSVEYLYSCATELDDKIKQAPHVVKMIGLVEYLSDEAMEKLFSSVAKFRDPSSTILISSIEQKHGIERFLNKSLNFYLNYRSPEKLKAVLKKYGYKRFDVFPEPSGVFNVLVGYTY